MAKTPLMRMLRRLAREHRLAHRLGCTLEALRERREAASMTLDCESNLAQPGRRRMLAASAAGALGLALPQLALARHQPKIAIVGAGIAGLTCALKLRDRGFRATVYEASRRVGGRMRSNRNGYWDDSQVSEWGGELIDSGHETMRALAVRFGLEVDDLLGAQPNGAEDTYHFFGRYYARGQSDRDFSQIFAALMRDLESAPFPTSFNSFTSEAQALDRLSVYDWIESKVPGGHSSPLGQLLDTAYAIEYAADTADQSALNLLYLLGFQPDESGQTLVVFGESDEAGHIRGGNDLLPQAIARHIGADESLRFGMRLVRIQQTPHGAYRLTFDEGHRAREVTADRVVLALPFAVLRELDFARASFNRLKQQAIRELGRGRNAKLQLQFGARLWNRPGPWPRISSGSSYADTGYQASWETSRAQAGAAGILTLFQGGSQADAAFTRRVFAMARDPLALADARRGLNQIEPVYPGLSGAWNGRATQSLWHLHPFARCSYSYYRVGQYTAFGGYEKARQGGVWFCGEHTSTEFQGFMEGGAAEGARAARQLARALGN